MNQLRGRLREDAFSMTAWAVRWVAMMALLIIILPSVAMPQTADSVDVTFYYQPEGNPAVVFVPGEFNNWGPNSSGTIAPNAPSQMDFDAADGRWFKAVRLRVGGPQGGGAVAGAYQYKFNENGTLSGWLPDPLNPRTNPADNNNSILFVNDPTIYHLLPNTASGVVSESSPRVSAYLYPAVGYEVDLASLRLVLDGTVIDTLAGYYDAGSHFLSFPWPLQLENGNHAVALYANSTSGAQAADSTTFNIVASPQVEIAPLPDGVIDGINYVDAGTVTLVLFAPRKNYVYLIGDFNDWQVKTEYLMKLTPDSSRFWLTLAGLQSGKEYAYQYFVNAELRIADPYADKILDPFHDRWISSQTYPNLKPYPAGKTSEIVSVFQTAQPLFPWQVQNFQKPEMEVLVIYELLIRDFIAAHDYKTLLDTLDYLADLGVNAIELMPFSEFEGNDSWGYNPSFYFAPDKYYGPKNDLKRFIDACHQRGIAVIQDIVLNHSFGQSPLVRLYATGKYGPPSADNPWYNVTARHPFNVGYDFNHESPATRAFAKRVLNYWQTEYRIDGFRFDLSKGFTQRFSTDDSQFRRYDASRIAILKDYADAVWAADSAAYVILEHFAENREEQELAAYRRGMMLWGNMNHNYNEATMGYHDNNKSDLSWASYKTRGWSKPRLISYMESHDEERLMYKNIRWGNSTAFYSVKDTSTALERIKAAAALFFTIPGPKMFWQFGELGYDYSIDFNGRLGKKPIRWDYLRQDRRRKLNKVFTALIKLKRDYPAFRSKSFFMDVRGAVKRININHASMDVAIVGNFDVAIRTASPNFPYPGNWYEYFSGDTLQVASLPAQVPLPPGAFRIYTSVKLPKPDDDFPTGVKDSGLAVPGAFALQPNFPNPFNPETQIVFDLPSAGTARLQVFDLLGREVATLIDAPMVAGTHRQVWQARSGNGNSLPSGVYLLRLQFGTQVAMRKMAVVR